MAWRNDWPTMGRDTAQTGTGFPVLTHKKPYPSIKTGPTPPENDEFNGDKLGLQWSWPLQPDPTWAFPFPSKGVLRLNAVLKDSSQNDWLSPMLLQKMPAETFSATLKAQFDARTEGERFGLVVFGLDYALLSVVYRQGQYYLEQIMCREADKKGRDQVVAQQPLAQSHFYLRVSVTAGAQCQFYVSTDGLTFIPFGRSFTAKEGKWVGAKIGFLCSRVAKTNDAGTVDVDWWRLSH